MTNAIEDKEQYEREEGIAEKRNTIYMGYKMKTSERVINALQRVKELLGLVADWTKQPKEEDATV